MFQVLCLIVFNLQAFTADMFKNNSCITPYQEKGICVKPSTCPAILSAFDTMPDQALQIWKDSHCGCVGGEVCCGPLIKNTYPQPFTCILKNNSCITPYQEEGICVKASTCPSILSALDTMPGQASQILKDSQCGCDSGKVCCGPSIKNTYPQQFTCDSTMKENITIAPVSDSSVCGLHKFSDRILGGTIADFGEFPWLAAIESNSKIRNDSAGIRCGGSIVSRRYILTAAHCIVHHEFVATRVWVGVTNIGPEGNCLNVAGNTQCIDSVQKIIIEEVYPYPTYNSINNSNDIGIVLLEVEIEYSEYVRPICLPSLDSATPKTGTFVTVAGWGATDQQDTASNIKLKVELPVQNNDVCNAFLKRQFREISAKQLCVGGEYGRDSCLGDSGGPLMKEFINKNGDGQWYQAGIVSYGDGCGHNGRPAVYTKVSSYVRWISDTIHKRHYDLAPGDDCTTPNGRVGKCVPIDTCKEVFTKVASIYYSGDFLYLYRCRREEHTFVCCEHPGSVIQPNFNSTALPNKTTCGVVKDIPRIYGGTLAGLGEFPWVVGVEYIYKFDNKNAGILSGGSVINSRYVLTAAGVIHNAEFKPITVWVGDWKISTDPDCNQFLVNVECADPIKKIRVKKVIAHFSYHPIYHTDNIALILLEDQIQFSEYVSPICLPPPNLPPLEPGTRLTVVGWGSTEAEDNSDILRKVEILLVSNEICQNYLTKRHRHINTYQLCVGGESDKGSCSGDPDGPLMRIYEDKAGGTMQWYQEGVVSYGTECGVEGRPAIYTKVSSYTNWIISIISED